MSGKAFIGRFLPGNSPVHKLDPRVKVVLSLAFVTIVIASGGWAGLGVCAAFTVVFFAISRISVLQALRSVAPMLAVVALTALLNLLFVQGGETLFQWWVIRVSEEGIARAALMSARLTLLLLGISLLTLTTSGLDITEALERLLSPLAKVGVPVHELAMMMGMALRFLPQLADELSQIRRAQAARGAGASGGPIAAVASLPSLAVPLFAGALRHAESLAVAMEARCYHGGIGRTRLHPLHLAHRDGAACIVMACMLACVVAVSLLGL